MTIATDPITRTAMCDAELHGRCKGQVLSIATGDRQCECECHDGAGQ